MPVDTLVSALVTLLVVVDPIGLAPIFLALTEGMTDAARRRVAARASLPAFRISGGLLLFAIAFEMVYGRRSDRQSRTAEHAAHEEHAKHIAAFPLAIPLLAGPGAITATLLLAGQTGGRPVLLAALLTVIAVVVGTALIVFCLAVPIGRAIGTTGNLVLSRLLGIILAALAVQFVIDGVRAVLRG
jgi:multiple antibiotic resistance protein